MSLSLQSLVYRHPDHKYIIIVYILLRLCVLFPLQNHYIVRRFLIRIRTTIRLFICPSRFQSSQFWVQIVVVMLFFYILEINDVVLSNRNLVMSAGL